MRKANKNVLVNWNEHNKSFNYNFVCSLLFTGNRSVTFSMKFPDCYIRLSSAWTFTNHSHLK